jgi:uncharacterized protein (TIGR03437 family)
LFASALLAQKPFQNGQAARAVVGQITFTVGNNNPSQQTLGGVSGIAWAGNRLYAADSNVLGATPSDNRVMVFDTTLIPTAYTDLTTDSALYGQPYCYVCGTQASLILGQNTFNPPTYTPSASGSTSETAYFPGVNGTQDPAGSSATENAWLNTATAVASDGIRLAVADTNNNRILIWTTIPTATNQHPNLVLGQPDFATVGSPAQNTYSAIIMRGPQGVWIANNKLYVADTQDNRVLIWNTFPTTNNQAPDVVLGQPDFVHGSSPAGSSTALPTAANQLSDPVSVTADSAHVYVADLGNNRVLIWNTTSPGMDQNADVVVGQTDLVSSPANSPAACANLKTGPSTSVTTVTGTTVTLPGPCSAALNLPRFALSDGTRLFIADGGNDRVLIYNTIPTTNGVSASNVLGQVTFYDDIVSSAAISIVSTQIDNTGGVDTIPTPTSLAWDGTNLYVADPFNRRVLIFTPGDTLLPSAFDPIARVVPVVNWASEIVRQEGTVALSLATGGKITAGDTATVTIQGTAFAYTEKSGDTLDGITRALVKLINASSTTVTATFAGAGTATLYLSSIQTNLGYDTITLAATTSNTANVVATASGSYLTAGNGATVSPGTLIEVNAPPGATFTDNTTPVTADLGPQIPATLDGVQLYLDGFASPLYKVSPTQIIGQIPYFYGDRNSTSVYVRTVHNDGSVTVTNATPVYIAPANPGIFNGPQYPRQVRPWPASMAYHQLNNPTAVVSVDGSITAANTGTITIGGTSYTYTVQSTDTLASVVTAFVNLINNGVTPDPHVKASAGGAFTRVVLTSKLDGLSGGNGIAVSTSTSSAATLTLTAYTSATCCAVQNGSVISASNPAVPGEMISITTAGLGSVNNVNGTYLNLNTGQPFPGPGTDDVLPANFVAATMGAETAQVIYAGLPTGSYGMYRVDMIVPSDLPNNDITPLYIAQNAFISNTVTLAVGAAVAHPPPPPGIVSQPVIFMSIDAPQSGSTISGVFHVGGWALDTSEPVSTVSIAVDGIPYANAGYGGPRPDACAGHPTGVNCPNVSFDYLLDTSLVGNGVHTFQVTVTDTAGNHFTSAATNVTIANNAASYPTHVNIDSPFGGATYHGVVQFSGWALNDTAGIVGFKGYIDGQAINDNAVAYGTPRPDVCAPAVYPGRPNCPNVGWSYLADLSGLANGTHTFSFMAIAANGQQYTVVNSFVVDNYAAATNTNGATVNIDTPSSSAGTLTGVIPVAGWAIDPVSNINNVEIYVDGVLQSNPTYGIVRKDVCAIFSTSPGCPDVGFSGALDTTLLSDGTHTLQVLGYPGGGQPYSATRQITVGNQVSNGVLINIDTPGPSAGLGGLAPIFGWAVGHSSPIQSVTISVDGILNGAATYGASRPDVCAKFPGEPSCPNVGWTYTLNTDRLTDGAHSLEVTATNASGERSTGATTFNVQNSSGAGKVNIDVPGPANNPFSGLALMRGSALNANAHIVSVTVSVDGVPVGNAAYGIGRPDVCTSLSVSPDCPNVGWSYSLNTTLLTDGSHTFGVLSTAADGTTASATSSFTVANETAVTPMTINIDSPGPLLSQAFSGVSIFGGWLYDGVASIQSVYVSIDGIPFGNAGVHGARPDVCTSTSVSPDCPNVGWTILVNTSLLSNDIHTLSVTGTTVAGQSYSVSRQFTSAN